MHQSIAMLADMYKINTRIFTIIVDSLDPDKLQETPLDKGTSAHWMIGHTVASRFTIARNLGLDETPEWASLFERGAPDEDREKYPSLDELKQAWAEISPKILSRFEEITEEELLKTPSFEFEGLEKSARGIVNFLYFHESYHLGQLAYFGRLTGGQQLFG